MLLFLTFITSFGGAFDSFRLSNALVLCEGVSLLGDCFFVLKKFHCSLNSAFSWSKLAKLKWYTVPLQTENTLYGWKSLVSREFVEIRLISFCILLFLLLPITTKVNNSDFPFLKCQEINRPMYMFH